MILFLTNTTTQLLNAIVIKNTILQNEKCDIYYTANLTKYIEQANLCAIFENSYKIELVKDILPRNNSVTKSLVRIKNGLDFSKVKKNLPSEAKNYSRVFASGISLRNYEFYYAIKSLNPKVKLSLFEEGMCEYYNFSLPHSRARSVFSHFFFHHYYFEECDSLYVYTPEAVKNTWNNISVKKIPYINENWDLISLINKIFGYEPTELKNVKGKVVILEQAFYDEEQIKNQEEILRSLVEVFGKNKIIIKLHPRSEKNKFGQDFCYVNTNIPLEIIALNEPIDKDNIFVSISSSSVLNFKLMLNREPIIILLNRYNNSKATEASSWHVFEYVKNAYRYNRFYIPANKEELLEAANALSAKGIQVEE